jgi:hypothetical protein
MRRLALTVGLGIVALWLSGCGFTATILAGVAASAGGGGGGQQTQYTWTLTAAGDMETATTGSVATDDPEAPAIEMDDVSVACATLKIQTTFGRFTDSGCGPVTVDADPLLNSVHVTGTIPSRVTDGTGGDIGPSSLNVDVMLNGSGVYDPQPNHTFTIALPKEGDPDAAAELFAHASLHRAAGGTGSVTSEKYGGAAPGPVNNANLYRNVVFTGAAMTCVQQLPNEECPAK